MDCKGRMNVENDRLSMLPNDLIHKILSFVSIKHAIETSALSSRWRFVWTSLPYFNISTDDFRSLPDFCEFVNHVLSRRNGQIELSSVNLTFKQTVTEALLKPILDYAFSHNLQQLTISCLYHLDRISFPLHLFRSHSLKYLKLTGFPAVYNTYNIVLASTWELPALTTLHLDSIMFCEHNDDNGVGLLSSCANLKNLTLNGFTLPKSRNFVLCHPQLSNLTIEDVCRSVDTVSVVAPLLENLTIRSSTSGKRVQIVAPNLASLIYHSNCFLQFSPDFPSLEKLDLCITSTYNWTDRSIAALLQQFHSVKFLTLNLQIVVTLFTYVEQNSIECSPFCNLKRFKIYPARVTSGGAYVEIKIPTKVMKYFLGGSPSATFTRISYKLLKIELSSQKAQGRFNASAAQKLMASLRAVMLDEEKANIESNRTLMDRGADTHDQGTIPVEKMQLQLERKMTEMKSYWKDVGVRIDHGRRWACYFVSQLREIEVLLQKRLPTSKREELQASYSSLCTEVDTAVKKILHHMSIPQIQLSDCFNELASTSLRPS